MYYTTAMIQCNFMFQENYTVDPVAAIFTGNPSVKCATERHNELREVDVQAAVDVEKRNSSEL